VKKNSEGPALTPTQVLGQMLSRTFGSGELGPYAEARDKKDFEALWGFVQGAGDEILQVTSERCRHAFETLSWQAVVIFAASHRHWKNALAVPGTAEDWASWSDARRQEWLNKVKQKPTTFPTAEVKRRNKKKKKGQEQRQRSRSKSVGRGRDRSPRVVVVKQARSRSRSRSRRRSPDHSFRRSRSRNRGQDGGRQDRSRSRSRDRRSRSRSRGGRSNSFRQEAKAGRARGGGREGRQGDEQGRGRSRARSRGRSRWRKPVCLDCGKEGHYADDEAFHPEHPKAMRYDAKGSPGRR